MDWIEVNGAVLRYETTGDGKDPIVLVHEMGGTLESFDAVMPALVRDHAILRYDQRGAGLSEKVRGEITLDALAEDLRLLIDRSGLPRPVSLVGLALGGTVAIRLATACPHLVKSLVLVSPAVRLPDAQRMLLQSRADEMEHAGIRARIDAQLAASYPEALRTDTTRFERLRAQRMTADPDSLAAWMRLLASIDIEAECASITCPSLIIAGRHDGNRPPETVAPLASVVRGARFSILDSCHFIPQHAPEAFAGEVRRFLASLRD